MQYINAIYWIRRLFGKLTETYRIRFVRRRAVSAERLRRSLDL